MDALKTRFPKIQMRVAFLGYRDVDHGSKQFEKLDFTTPEVRPIAGARSNAGLTLATWPVSRQRLTCPWPTPQKFSEFLGKVEPIFGADPCEDVHGGLHETLNLGWRDMAGNKV